MLALTFDGLRHYSLQEFLFVFLILFLFAFGLTSLHKLLDNNKSRNKNRT